MARNKNIEIKGLKELQQMFEQLPKQVNKDKIWLKFWKENSKPAVEAAQTNANKFNKTGQLKKSIGFFTTKKSRKFLGGYVGPRVKGRFSSGGNMKAGNKKKKYPRSGFYGAMIEYGGTVMFGGKGLGKNQPYMKPAWNETKRQMLSNSMRDGEKVIANAIKRLNKYGKFGY